MHCTWTVRSTKLLLKLFKERKIKFRNPKIRKRTLWTDIMKEMQKMGYTDVNEDILDRKLRNLKKTYRTIKDNNKKTSTGRGRITWEYYDTFEDIFSDDRTINFGSTISSFSQVTNQAFTTVSRPNSISTDFSRSTPSPQLAPAKVIPTQNSPSSISTDFSRSTPSPQLAPAKVIPTQNSPSSISINFSRSTPSPQLAPAMVTPIQSGLSMNCTPTLQSNARSSPLSNPIAADSFIELDINVNSNNSICTSENEYLNNGQSSEMSDSVSKYPLKSVQKRRDSKQVYNMRKKLVAVEEERIKAIEQLTKSVEENNSIQKERNELLKQFLTKM
ncbi:hypothetical protein ALC60_11274 [Trachymyrmex zeteki]|uniref:Myb/SANT-like DNA-binding domain-containing protein n=1 Tax=Mycetomoellerius zeteki TaxID=64791 RepID=A0A151WPC7_9HYME|nr:hypothetical protein ALC60_11274 [Trachymyrmex zeteki]